MMPGFFYILLFSKHDKLTHKITLHLQLNQKYLGILLHFGATIELLTPGSTNFARYMVIANS